MGRRKNQASGCGWAIAVLFVISVAGPLAPVIAIALGIGGIFYVIKRLGGHTTSAQPVFRPLEVPLPYDYTAYADEVRAIQKKLAKPGQWKTQVDRIGEGAKLQSRIEKSAASAAAHRPQYLEIVKSLDATIKWAVQQTIPAMNRHFVEQTEKLQEMTSSLRIAKNGQTLLDQLAEIASVHAAFHNVTATLALPIKEMVSTAQQTNSFKSRVTDAKKAEREGKREDALHEYLDLLYALKTDSIDDDDQANEIAELEDHVRRVVRSYAKPRSGKKTYTVKPHLRRMPNT